MKNIYPITVHPTNCVIPIDRDMQLQWIELRSGFMEQRLERYLKVMNAQITLQSIIVDLQFEDYQPTIHVLPQLAGDMAAFEKDMGEQLAQLDWQPFVDSFRYPHEKEVFLEMRKPTFYALKKVFNTYLVTLNKGAFIPTEVAYFTRRAEALQTRYCVGIELHLFDPLTYMHLSKNEFFMQAFRSFYKDTVNEYSHLAAQLDGFDSSSERIEALMEQSEVSISENLRYHGEKRFLKVLKQILSQAQKRTYFKRDITDTLNMISSLTYESTAVRGQLLICPIEHVTNYIALTEPIPLEKVRRVRKLLQTATSRVFLLCDGEQIYGMTQDMYKPNHAVEIIFKHTLFWQVNIYRDGEKEAVLQMNNSIPQIVSVRLNEQKIEEAYMQVFGDPIPKNMQLTIRQAKKQAKGTMLVISNKAAQESKRLMEQSFPIKNTQQLNRKMVQSLTMVDGALLMDPDSQCYAFGVILDGIVSGAGDITRGARYNAAIKYLSLFETLYTDGRCLIVVISEDNLVDVLGTI